MMAANLLHCASQTSVNPDPIFSVATYNTHYMERGISGITKTLRESNADVIAMQEVLVVGGRPTSLTIANTLGYRHVSSRPYVAYGDVQWVLAILSRYPIARVDQKRLGRSRRALRATVSIKGKQIEFITMHLTPLSGGRGAEEVRRRAQARRAELHDLLAWTAKDRLPRILLGDFNMLRGTMGILNLNEYNLLIENGYKDADGGWLPTNSDTFPLPSSTRMRVSQHIPGFLVPESITLDYMFITPRIDVLETGVIQSDSSDHWPLVGQFRLKR